LRIFHRLQPARRLIAGVLAFLFLLGPAVLQLEAKKNPKAGTSAASAASTNFTFDTNAYIAGPGAERRTGGGGTIFSILSSLFFICLILVGLYYFLKFIAKKQNQGNVNKDIIRVIAQSPVAVGRYLTVVKILNTFYILGLAEGGVSLIREVTDRTEIDQLRELETRIPQNAGGNASFQDYLKDVLGRFKRPDKTPAGKVTPDRILNFMNTQKDRLDKLNGLNGKNGSSGKNGGGKA